MTRLLNRRVTVTLARYRRRSFTETENNAVSISNLRVSFTARRSLDQSPNTCEISIYNLSESTRAEFQQKPLRVILDAGYEDEISTLFVGDVSHASPSKVGTEWKTKLIVGDGVRASRFARIGRSFKSGVRVKDALNEVAESMGLKIPSNIQEAKELAKKFSSGVTLEGPSNKELTRLLTPAGMSWSIQSNRLQILRRGEFTKNQAVVVSPESGMVGSPELGTPQNPGDDPVITVRTLLDPRILPGGRVSIDSRLVSGVFRCERVSHVGDTHGAEWFTVAEVTNT